MVEVPHPTRRKNEGKKLGRKHLELSEKRRAFARKKRRGKRAERKSARKKHKAARARSRLEEFQLGTFNFRTAAVNGVNGISRHIDTLLRTCAAKGCDVIGLQETKRDGTFEISASGYCVFFSSDCRMVKGRKGQHGVGLVIKEIIKKAGEDGITIECISAHLLKARIPIESNFVTFVVAYAPTEEAPEGQKAIYMAAALNCTIASVPAREYVFVLTDANARTGKRGEGGGEADSIVLGAYGRDRLNENGKLLLGLAEDNKLALLNTFFHTPKSGVSYTFQSANRSEGQARLDYILTKQADRRLIRCVNVRRPPLEAPESDHNLVYAKVRIPRRSAPNQRKRGSTKETPKLADLRRLMTDPNLGCQVANVMVDALPPIPDGTCIGDIATDMANVMLSTAAELVPRSKRSRGAQGWCAGSGVEAEMNAEWQQTEEARRHLRAELHNSNLRKAVKMAGKKLWKVRKAAVLSFFWDFVHKLETRTREGNQAGFYKHLKTMTLEGKRDRSSAYVEDENGVLLRDVELIRERWVRWFHTLLNAKSPRLDPNIAEGLDQWPENMPLGVQPTMQELTDAIRSLANLKAVGPDGVSVELFKITLNGNTALRLRQLDIVVRIWRGARGAAAGVEGCHHHGTPQKEGSDRVRQLQRHLAGSASRQDTTEDHRSPPQREL